MHLFQLLNMTEAVWERDVACNIQKKLRGDETVSKLYVRIFVGYAIRRKVECFFFVFNGEIASISMILYEASG